jgi:hypothetical protein
MKVVEIFIKDQAQTTIMQAFIEANFINDMMNLQSDILSSVIEHESRKILRSVLSDIYFAHICTLFLENQLITELRSIAHETLNEQQLIVSTSDLMLVDTSQYIEENESSLKLNEVENQFEKNQHAL